MKTNIKKLNKIFNTIKLKTKKEYVVGFRISKEEREYLQKIADKNDRTISQVLQLWTKKLLIKGDL